MARAGSRPRIPLRSRPFAHEDASHAIPTSRPSGLQVSVLSLGSWVTYGNQVDTAAAREMLAAAMDAGVNFFDNAEVYARRRERASWARRSRARLAAPELRHLDQVLLGPRTTAQHEEHAEPQVPDAGDRRLARAARPRLRRPACSATAPTRTRRSRRRCGRCPTSIASGKALYWGTSRVGGRRDPRRVGHRRAPSPAQAGDGAAAVQPARTASASSSSTRGSTTTSASGSRPGARSRRGLLTGKYLDGIPAGQPRRARGHEWLQQELTDDAKNGAVRAARRHRRRPRLHARAARDRVVRAKNPHVSTRDHRRLEARRRCRRTSAALDVVAKLTPEVLARIDEITQPLAQ